MATFENMDVMLYAITGIFGFLIVVLFAIVINLYLKVNKLTKDDDDDDDDRSDINVRNKQEPDFVLPKPMVSKGRQQYPPNNNSDLPERNYGRNDSPDRNHGLNDNDFSSIDFNNRMTADTSFKPPQTQAGGSHKNPQFDHHRLSDLGQKYDYVDPRNKQQPKPPVPGFRLPPIGVNNYNQPNDYSNMHSRREFQPNNNFRY